MTSCYQGVLLFEQNRRGLIIWPWDQQGQYQYLHVSDGMFSILFNDDNILHLRSETVAVRSSAHSPTFPSHYLRHNLISNTSVALPTSQLILQPFRCFTYFTVHSPTLLSLLLRHKLFT